MKRASVKKIFKSTPEVSIISQPTNFPSGLAVKTEKSTYWIKDGKRYRLISDRAAESWNFPTVLATESAVVGFKVVGKLGFRDGTLIKNISDGKIYLVSQNKKRHITSPDVFEKYGLNRSLVLEVGQEEVNMHEEGESL